MNKRLAAFAPLFLIILAAGCVPGFHKQDPDTPNAPTQAPSKTPEIVATTTPESPARSLTQYPDGVLSMGSGTNGVRLTTVEGDMIDEFQFRGFILPNNIPNRSYRFHFGGNTREGVIESPCFFFTSISGDKQISFHQSKSPIIDLQELQELTNLVGAPRQPEAVFASYDPESVREFNQARYSSPEEAAEAAGQVGVKSSLFKAFLNDQPQAELIFSQLDQDGYAIYPLALEMDDDNLIGVYYTQSYLGMFGGGPIIYSGFRGLFHFDLEIEQETTILEKDFRYLSLSFDQTRIAFLEEPPDGGRLLVIKSLLSGKEQEIDLLPETGPTSIGNAYFSPSGVNLAWQEHYLGDDGIGIIFRFSLDESEKLLDLDMKEIVREIENPDIYLVKLGGWLDNDRILIEGIGSESTELFILDLDQISLTYLSPGRFMGFTYREGLSTE